MSQLKLALALLLCVSGCADILDIPDSPTLVANDRWHCPAPPAQQLSSSGRARVTIHACNFVSNNCSQPVTGVTGKLCNRRDYGCTKPLASEVRDRNDGDLVFEVETAGSTGVGFDGFVIITPPSAPCTDEELFGGPGACTLVPDCDPNEPASCIVPIFNQALVFFNPPITADVTNKINVQMLPIVSAINLVKAAGSEMVDINFGSVIATAVDCEGKPAERVTFALKDGPPKFGSLYQENGVPRADLFYTDDSGMGALLGVPPGFATVTATVTDEMSGIDQQIATASIQIVPATFSYVTMIPRHD